MKLKRMNKKGMLDDLADFLFTIFASFFLLVFISMALTGSIDEDNKEALSKISEFKRFDAGTNNLRVQMYGGHNLEDTDLDQMVAYSRTYQGRTIVNCADYYTKKDCDADIVELYYANGGRRCKWSQTWDGCVTPLLPDDTFDFIEE